MFEQLLCSPDLASSDIQLCTNVNKILAEKPFGSNEEVRAVEDGYFVEIP